MSERKEKFVSESTCSERTQNVMTKINDVSKKGDKILEILIGPDMVSGLAAAVKRLEKNSKSHLTGKDKAYLLGCGIVACTSVIVAFLKS